MTEKAKEGLAVVVVAVVSVLFEAVIIAACAWAIDIPQLTFLRAVGGVVLLSMATKGRRE